MHEKGSTGIPETGKKGENIINTCSVGAMHHTAGVAYCAAKAALTAATRNTAFMYMEQGIRVQRESLREE